MNYQNMWFTMKEFLLDKKGKGEMLTADLLDEMCKIEICENEDSKNTKNKLFIGNR